MKSFALGIHRVPYASLRRTYRPTVFARRKTVLVLVEKIGN